MKDFASSSPRFVVGRERSGQKSGDEIEDEERVAVLLDLRVRRDRSIEVSYRMLNHEITITQKA